jgi:hypothetical protein
MQLMRLETCVPVNEPISVRLRLTKTAAPLEAMLNDSTSPTTKLAAAG